MRIDDAGARFKSFLFLSHRQKQSIEKLLEQSQDIRKVKTPWCFVFYTSGPGDTEHSCLQCALAHVILQLWCRFITCALLPIQTHTHTHLFLSRVGCVFSVQSYSLSELCCWSWSRWEADTHEVIITDWVLCDNNNQHTYFCPHIIHYGRPETEEQVVKAAVFQPLISVTQESSSLDFHTIDVDGDQDTAMFHGGLS